jgi:hypothetical protein
MRPARGTEPPTDSAVAGCKQIVTIRQLGHVNPLLKHCPAVVAHVDQALQQNPLAERWSF